MLHARDSNRARLSRQLIGGRAGDLGVEGFLDLVGELIQVPMQPIVQSAFFGVCREIADQPGFCGVRPQLFERRPVILHAVLLSVEEGGSATGVLVADKSRGG